MPVNYSITKFKDTYQITNNDIVSITVSTLISQEGCLTFLEIKTPVIIEAGLTKTFSLAYDGEYRLNLLDENGGVTSIKLLHYLSLEKSIVAGIQYILCDCAKNVECAECKGDYGTHQLSTMLKIFSYQRLTHPKHLAFIETIFESLQCSVRELTQTLLTDEQTTDQITYIDLVKEIMSFYYLAFYHSELKGANQLEIDYINTKYNYTAISQCIDAVLLTDVQTKINNMATYTVISGAYVNQPPVVGDFTIERPNRVVSVASLDQFTSLTTPPYSDPEGDPVDALRVDSIPGTNLGKYQYDNVDITVGLIIPAAHITAGRLVHIGADIDTAVNDYFGFSLRDIGSMTWVS